MLVWKNTIFLGVNLNKLKKFYFKDNFAEGKKKNN
jgi:hypothetical protein